MKGRRHTPEQVVRKLREADRLLGEGFELPDVLKELEVSEATYHRWRAQYGGMKADDVKRLEGAGGREREVEADRGRSDAGDRGAEGAGAGKLVSPARRRQAVLMLQDRLGMSERRACRLAGQHRSTQRHEPVVADDDAALRARLRRDLAGAAAVGVSPRASAAARRRVGAEHQAHPPGVARGGAAGAAQAPQAPAARRVHGAGRRGCGPSAPDHVWAIDFQWDQTADGHNLKLLHVVDEFTREALAIECHRRIDADQTVDVLDRLVTRARDGARVRALRQRAGDDRQRAEGLVPLQPGRQRLHRARLAVAERLRGELRRPRPRRAARPSSCSPA